ncbi:MAG: VOC family protein [Gammaproteobacteria bacterium]|nr:MAG: VOC family protein [Gammaproteobacteria bacterium]
MMRLQLALNVSNLERAVAYYSRLFGVAPHKRKPGYANFAIDDPALKLVLFEKPEAKERLNHLGVEVFDEASLDASIDRVQSSDLAATRRSTSVCCHAEQDKIWSVAPDGERWEFYRIVDDAPERKSTACCA